MLAIVIPLVLFLVLLYFLFPRSAKNSDAPPMIESTIKIPLIGQIIEFAKSPVKMVERCYRDYGPVFTVPVSDKLQNFFCHIHMTLNMHILTYFLKSIDVDGTREIDFPHRT